MRDEKEHEYEEKRNSWAKSGRGRERQPGKERETEDERMRETVHLIWMKTQRDICAGGMYMCYKVRMSVTPQIRISLDDSPSDQHT